MCVCVCAYFFFVFLILLSSCSRPSPLCITQKKTLVTRAKQIIRHQIKQFPPPPPPPPHSPLLLSWKSKSNKLISPCVRCGTAPRTEVLVGSSSSPEIRRASPNPPTFLRRVPSTSDRSRGSERCPGRRRPFPRSCIRSSPPRRQDQSRRALPKQHVRDRSRSQTPCRAVHPCLARRERFRNAWRSSASGRKARTSKARESCRNQRKSSDSAARRS
mmetsp:Transcript_10989/g.24820  ORF Transcript_10989/g.24820 Transcript_10989/m.24820 type:complete len:216 (-) Transcript_10989:2436-3083(-)